MDLSVTHVEPSRDALTTLPSSQGTDVALTYPPASMSVPAHVSGVDPSSLSPDELALNDRIRQRAVESKTPRAKRKPRPPKDTKVYKVAIATVALRAQGLSYADIGEQLGHTAGTVKAYLFRAHRLGYLNIHSFDDPSDSLDVVLRSKAVRNINALLDGDADFKGDKDTTLEVAKGLGMLKQHQVVKGDTAAPIAMALSVRVEMPPAPTSASGITVNPANVGGSFSRGIPVDAEIVSTSEE